MLARPSFLPELNEALSIVARFGQRQGFLLRVAEAHPSREPHNDQWDARVRDCLREATAFAWAAEVAKLGTRRFSDPPGPDIHVASSNTWVEVKTVNLSDIRDFVVFRPSLEVQRDFAIRITEAWRLRTRQQTSLSELDSLFSSLQHRAFRGEL